MIKHRVAAILMGLIVVLAVFSVRSFSQESPIAAEEVPASSPSPSAGVADDSLTLAQVVSKLQENYEKIGTYEADFEQEIWSVSQGRVVTKASGEVIYKKPGKMVWHYTKPDEHIYINAGDTIWDYSPQDREAYQLPVKDSVYKSFLVGLGNLEKDFEISFHGGNKLSRDRMYQIDLVPKNESERQVLGTLTFYVDPADFLVKRTESVDALGNRNRIVFTNFKLNRELDDKLFKFTPPAGVKVIKAEELMK